MKRWPGDAGKERTAFGELYRGELMSRVRSSGNQTTEGRLASLLRRAGVSGWRRHQPLPGHPDFAWPSLMVAVFVDGCFWHGHDCGRNLTPRTNAKAWREKIERNQARDRRATSALRRNGWSVLRIWECNLVRRPNRCLASIERRLMKRIIPS